MRKCEGRYVICGDFNYPGIKWGESRSDAKGREFVELVEAKFMHQHVNIATHISGNTLDLVLSSTENLVGETSTEGRLGSSDHEIIKFLVEIEVPEECNTRKRDYRKANWEEMRRKLQRDWRTELEEKDTEETWSIIKQRIHEAMEECIPWKNWKIRKKPVWMNGKIGRLIAKKKKLWKKSKETGERRDKEEYKKAEKELKKNVRNAKKNMEKKVAEEGKKKPKQFF